MAEPGSATDGRGARPSAAKISTGARQGPEQEPLSYQVTKRATYARGHRLPCHCEERSDAAIPRPENAPAPRAGDCRVATLLAMTGGHGRDAAGLGAGESIIKTPSPADGNVFCAV